MMKFKTRILQVSNIAPQATKDQMSSLFGYLGKIEDIRLYPTIRDVSIPVQSRICFVKFHERDTIGVGLHLTNTVFIDRALVVIPYNGEMPDEKKAMEILTYSGSIPGLGSDTKWPSHILNHFEGIILKTADPKLEENGLPEYPNLPATTESFKINEIRRTVVFDNINAQATTEEILEFAEKTGAVRYLRLGSEKDGTKNCLVEYDEQPFIIDALKMHGEIFMDLPIKVNHSTVAIIKPQTKSIEAAQREIEEAMRRVKDAQNSLFSANMDPLAFLDAATKEKSARSRSRSHSHSRRSHSRRSRSRRKSRSSSRSTRHRSRSRKRSHRSRSRDKKARSKSRSRRSRSRSRHKSSHKDKRDKDKSKDKDKDRSRDKDKKREKENDFDKIELIRQENDGTKDREIDNDEKDMTDIEDETRIEDKEEERDLEREVDDDEDESDIKREKSLDEEEMEEGSANDETKVIEECEKEKDRSKEKDIEKKSKARSRSRSRSPRSKRHKSRSRSRSRKRSRSRSKARKSKRSRRSSSRSGRHSRSRSRSRRERRRSKSRDRRHRSLSSSRNRRSHRDHSRSKDRHRSKSKDRRDRRERDRKREREKKEKKKDKKDKKGVVRNYDEEEEGYEGDETKDEFKSKAQAIDMDISNSP